MTQLLLLHGALATKNQFDTFIPLLKNEFESDAINFTGHGGLNIPTQGYTFTAFANDILSFADKHRIEKINLFGYSMGGYAALYFAKLYPTRVNKIFTLNTKFNWDPLSTAKETAMLDAEKMVTKVPGYANQLMMQHGLNLWKQVINQTSEMMQQLSKEVLLVDEDFKNISVEVLLGVGDKDTTASIEETYEVYKKIPKSQLMVLPNTPHPFDKINHEILRLELVRFFTK